MAVRNGWAAQSPYERIFDFIAPDADRFAVLLEHVKKLRLNFAVIPVEGNRHFFIFPPGVNLKLSAGDKFPFSGQTPVALTAHYDRVPGSPGANDNSAAVFQLLRAAQILGGLKAGNWIVIFTDKEELQSGEGICNQGSFSLAKKLIKWGLGNIRIFNFDACGTGETLIISTTADYLLQDQTREGLRRARQAVNILREQAIACARRVRFRNALLIPTPFCDDAGFLQGGIPVQTITVLPSAEAAPFASLLQKRPDFADLFIAGSIKNTADLDLLPETWRRLNSPADTPARLTPEHYEQLVRFAAELCQEQQF
jgi:hypothetical protein